MKSVGLIVISRLRSGAFVCAVAGLLFLVFGSSASVADETPTISGAAPDPMTWFEEMEAYFEANPEMKTTSGSGYKPFSRYQWSYEQRLVDGRSPALAGGIRPRSGAGEGAKAPLCFVISSQRSCQGPSTMIGTARPFASASPPWPVAVLTSFGSTR